jgi:hypothetical protein
MLQGYIVDPDTGKVVAVIRKGEVFREDKEGAKIATVLNANLYDLSGNLVGRLDGPNAIDVKTWSMPLAVRNLLEGKRRPECPDTLMAAPRLIPTSRLGRGSGSACSTE